MAHSRKAQRLTIDRRMVGRALVSVLVALPWLNPLVAGPSPSAVPLIASALALAALLLLARFLDVSRVAWAWLLATLISAVMGLLQYVGVDTLFAPVSYTHLDVYKRQALNWRVV